jgi:hypothetical protein
VLPLSISSILSFPQSHLVAAYIFFLIFQYLLFPPITYFSKEVRSGMSVDIPTMMVGNKCIYYNNWMISWEEITQVTEI